MGNVMAGSTRANHTRSAAMDETGSTESFKRFALALYGSEDVADACLYLQNRHDLDVNLVLFAAFVGAKRHQRLTASSLEAARARVDAWHSEVVRPLRAVRQRLKTGPAPAPNEITAHLRRRLQQVEIDAELIELDQLCAVVAPRSDTRRTRGNAREFATAAIETVVQAYSKSPLDHDNRHAINTIAAIAARRVNPDR
jgi:uncharacterized protein (TIGR02444 family)